MDNRLEFMDKALKQLRSGMPAIEAAVIISADAMPLASNIAIELDEEVVSAMSASILSLGERAANELKRGVLDQVFIRGDQGYMLVTGCGKNAMLAMLMSPDAKLGVMFMEARKVAEELAEVL